LFHTGSTERKKEFFLMTVGENRMVEVSGRQDLTFDESKVGADVGGLRVGDKRRVTFGVHTGLVHPGVQGGHIDVMYLLTGRHAMVQFHGIGTTPAKSVAWIQGFCELKGSHKRTDAGGGVFETGPITFPHFYDMVSELS